MGYEIEFLPVGEGTRAGDAICIRYTDVAGRCQVLIVDGGTDDSGTALVDHVRQTYGTNFVADVVSTHPDTDHSCGLRTVLRELNVGRLWMHGLWSHASDMIELFEDHRWTRPGLAKAIRDAYPVISELVELADEQGTMIYEPFFGAQIGPFTVLAPQRLTYQHLVPQFRKTPAAKAELLKARGMWLNPQKGLVSSLTQAAGAAFEKLVSLVWETWDYERLKEGGLTAAENESSVVMLGRFGEDKVLLTGDAGVNALNWAVENAAALGHSFDGLKVIQIPHHGSRRNVSPSVLDRIIGPPVAQGSPDRMWAAVSVPKDDTKHPRRMVVNAFTRRGAPVLKTQGARLRIHAQMPGRLNEGNAQAFEFFGQVEDYD